ncbi:hypothetical protein [Salinibaculum salinum]|uniref:hypothetical protein n=1 Tax=Salinibaculum salinum TaxID=3131996 RepID=UPI0030EB4FD3
MHSLAMIRPVSSVYQSIDDVRPLVRPTGNQFEVDLLPPYGDPEVNLVGEAGTYVVAGILLNAAIESLDR